MGVLVLLVKSYTSRDLSKAREALPEAENDSKRIRGQLKVIQFERAPISKQLTDLERTLVSQNKEILGVQTQLGKIADENAKLKADNKRR